MALVSQEALLGMLIPDIYIDAVTLESSGTPAIVDNPHIDDVREHTSRVRYEEAVDNRTLRVIVDLSLKEKLDNSLIGSWFRKQEFHKYLKIQVFETTHPGLISLFSHSQNMINFVTEGINPTSVNWSSEEQKAINDACGSPELAAQVLSNRNLFQTRILSVSADVVGDNSDLTQISSSLDNDGNSIHDFTYRAVFELSVLNPDELATFAVSYLDLGALKADYDLEFNVGTLDSQNGKVVSEKIISKGSVVSTAMVFTTPEGEMWTGPVHQTGKFSYSTGSKPLPSSVKLKKRSVPNDVVQDFRDVAEIMKYSLDITPVSKGIDSIGSAKARSNDREFVEHKKAHFSDIWISRDPTGASRFMFAFDKKSFLQHNSFYGFLLDRESPAIRNQILEYSKVREITVLRRRVKETKTLNKLGSISDGHVLFDKGEPYESLIMTAADRTGRITERTNGVATIRESRPTVTNSESTLGVHYYTAQDKEVSKFTDGIYQYGVRINIEDGAVDYLRSITATLINQKEDIKTYLDSAMKLGMTKVLLEVADPHIDHSSERRASIIQNKGHYDPLRNRFTNRFITFMDDSYVNEISPFYQKRPWIDAALTYANALSVLSKDAEAAVTLEKLNLDEKISKFMSPASGTPQGIMAIMSLYDTLIAKYRSMTGDDYRDRGRASMSPPASSQASASHVSTGENNPPHMIEVENWFFDNHFDSNVKKSMGLDYLTDAFQTRTSGETQHSRSLAMTEYAELAIGAKQNRGLKVIDGGTWKTRIQSETRKYFSDENPNINLSYGRDTYTDADSVARSSYGFLSPSYIVANNEAHAISLEQETSYYVKVEADLLAENSNRYVVLGDDTAATNRTTSEKLYQSTLQNIFAGLGVTVTSVAATTPIPQIYSGMAQKSQAQAICEAQQLQAVDPYPAWNTDEDGNIVPIPSEENRGTTVGEKNSNFVDFYKKVSDIPISDKVQSGDMNSSSSRLMIQRFDARESGNIFSNLKEDSRLGNRILSANGSSGKPTMSNVISSFPNQIKSVFHSSINPGATRDTTTTMDGWTHSSKFNLNYQFISMVERFDGFDYVTTTNGTGNLLSVKKERWVQLTENYYASSEGMEIICRLSPYGCESLGIVRKEGIGAPTYDKYFIIVPQREGRVVSGRTSNASRRRAAMESRWRSSAQTRGQFTTTNLITK